MPPPPTPTNPQPFPRPRQHLDSEPTTTITATQRSEQARAQPTQPPSMAAAYEDRQERARAAQILASTELLLWFSAARGESLPQTRHYFQTILLGLEPAPPVWREAYEEPHKAGKGREKDKEKGKESDKDREKKRRS